MPKGKLVEPKKEKEVTVAPVDDKPTVKKGKTPQLIRGFRDILPEEQVFWDKIRHTAEGLAKSYTFERIGLPILEAQDLFVRSIGKQTDIVEKEMFAFEDPGGDRVVLRPEGTASVARAYIEHGMLDRPQPVKLFYIEPMMRYDRPQAGRYRQHYQFGAEMIGTDDPIADAQVITLAYSFYKELGLDVVMRMNSIGTPESRTEYKVELVAHYRRHRNDICEDCKRRLQKNPLRVLDCKEESCAAVKNNAPQILDYLDDPSKEHFMKVLEYLDEVGVKYVLAPHLVRGLDYYTRTVFEVGLADSGEDESRQSALGGGGRYDGLIEQLGGRPTPACGFGLGIERAILAMKEKGIQPELKAPDVFLAPLGDAARRKGLSLFETLRAAGVICAEAFGKSALKAQLEQADRLHVLYTLILGQKEVLDGTIIIRDMESGAQETVDIKKVASILQKKIADRTS